MFAIIKKDKIDQQWRWYALMAFAATLVVNGLAGSTTLLNGQNTAAVSDKYENLFAPAGFTFAIWGVIYLLLAIFCLRIFEVWKTPKPRIANKKMNESIKLFTVTSVLNAAWLFAWQYEVLWLSVLLMIALLSSLIVLHKSIVDQKKSPAEYLSVQLPFSVYLGWISVATIANITTWLVQIGWNGWGISESAWTVSALIIGAAIGVTTALVRRDWAYLAVFMWAYFGILYKHLTFFDGAYQGVILTLTMIIPVFTASCLCISGAIQSPPRK